ncbi:MAG: hypothetical protein R3B57_12805 [Phycisphaerales bacterium]
MPVALLATTAPAQDLLDLDKPETPDVGEKAAAVTLAETLEAQADLFDLKAEEAAAIRGDVRRLAAALLRSGQEAGDKGASRLLAGRTLVNHLKELDALGAGAWSDDLERLLVLGDLERVRGQIPADDEGLDRALREALWRLGERAENPPDGIGWVEDGGTHTVSADAGQQAAARLRELGLDDEAMAGVDRLLSLADDAETRRSFASAAWRVRTLLSGAVGALNDPPRWIEDEQIAAGARDIAQAATSMLDPKARDDAHDRLRRYAALATLIRRADTLDRTNDAKALRSRLAAWLGEGPPASTLDALTQALDLLDAIEGESRDEKSLIRQLRPAWRWCKRSSVLSGRTLTGRLVAIADTPDPLTNPGVLSDLAAARAPLELGDALFKLSDRLDQDPAGPADRPEVAGGLEEVAARVLRASAALDDTEQGARAREMILRISDDFLRADALASVAEPRLATIAADVRAQMIAAWSEEDGDPDEVRPMLTRVENAARWVENAALAKEVEGDGSLVQAWAAFELSPEAAKALRGDADRLVNRVVASLEKGDIKAADTMLGRLDKEHAATALVGALERALRARTGLDKGDPSWSVIAEMGEGPPDASRAWLIDQRGRLAQFCAQAEELAAATIRDDRPAAGDLRAALNTTAAALLRAVEGR